MATAPLVSVVMGVRDAGHCVCATLDSVLAQRGVALECVVVDDGSTDDTPRRVARAAAVDPRVRLLRQAPAGLTRALINGCSEARGELVARIDAGDRMLPGRLHRQVQVLAADPGIHVLATAVRLCGPRGEVLEPRPDAVPGPLTDLTAGFHGVDPAGFGGVPHMSVCFRLGAYRAAGGYRPAFHLAQDLDLWARMAEAGRVARLEEALTEARVGLDGLSPRHHRAQLALRGLAAQAARTRRLGGDEPAVLARVERLSRQALARGGGSGAGAYFVAGCLARRGALAAAEEYLRLALRRQPVSVRTLLALARVRARRLVAGAGAAP